MGKRKRESVEHSPEKESSPSLPQDAKLLVTFEQFVANLPAMGTEINFLPEELRVFIWSLIDKIYQYHSIGLSVDCISSCRVWVDKHNVPYLKGKLVPASAENMSKSYKGIHGLLSYIFGPSRSLSASLSHFMSLLKGDLSDKDIYLMRVHVSILPSSLLCAFIIDLILITGGLTHARRYAIFTAIDTVQVDEDWMLKLKVDSHLLKVYNEWIKDTQLYLVKCPDFRTFMKLKFFRNALQHCGLQKRPRPLFTTEEYDSWKIKRDKQMGRNPYDESLSLYQHKSDLKDVMTIERVLKSLFEVYPNFLHQIQLALSDEDALVYFSINPSDIALI